MPHPGPSDLGAIKATLIVLPKVMKVNLDPKSGKSKWTLDEADQLQQFREGMLVNYTYSDKTFGSFSLADEVVSFNKKNLKRKVNELKELLPYLRNVKRVESKRPVFWKRTHHCTAAGKNRIILD